MVIFHSFLHVYQRVKHRKTQVVSHTIPHKQPTDFAGLNPSLSEEPKAPKASQWKVRPLDGGSRSVDGWLIVVNIGKYIMMNNG